MSKINRQGRSINGADVRHLLRIPIPPFLPPAAQVVSTVDATLGAADEFGSDFEE